MNQNSPNNPFDLLSYLNREQYGAKPLVYGPYYNAPLDNETPYLKGSAHYVQRNGKYVISDYTQKQNFDTRFMTFFPRMFSNTPDHVKEYKNWANIKGVPIQVTNREGESETLMKPTFGDNLSFFFSYQINWMYWRYFMWNFAGRQNDIQGNGDIINGNWITGFNFLDSIRLGDQNHLPSALANNKGKNKFYMLPLILGLLGLFFQFNAGVKGKLDFWVILSLFVMTGMAIIIYLNQEPLQPRERDYAYVGSFYAFAIWIGIGVMAIIEKVQKKLQEASNVIDDAVVRKKAVERKLRTVTESPATGAAARPTTPESSPRRSPAPPPSTASSGARPWASTSSRFATAPPATWPARRASPRPSSRSSRWPTERRECSPRSAGCMKQACSRPMISRSSTAATGYCGRSRAGCG